MSYDFSPIHKYTSAIEDPSYTQMWIDSAGMVMDLTNSLLKHNGYVPKITQITTFENPDAEELKRILDENRSDKAGHHNYHILYSYILNELGKNRPLDVLEIGLGTNNTDVLSSMGRWGRPGASLYSWEKYLPNANIYGADIDRRILFNSGRIRTTFVDQMKAHTFTDMQNAFGSKRYNLFIDDGLHAFAANFNTLMFALDKVEPDGWIVIEDIGKEVIGNWFSVEYILSKNPKYKVFIVEARISYLFVVHKLA
jgi:hypothetical protein